MKNNILKLFGVGLTAVVAMTSCSDDFLQEKKNYDNVTSDIYNYYSGTNARMNDIYSWCLPDVAGSPSYKYNSTGNNDDQAKSTEEYSGFGAFVNPEAELTTTGGNSVPDYFQGVTSNIQENAWGRIRNINDFIAGVEGGSLSDAEKDEFIGQALFFRAWCYYNLVKWYGGVPIITEVQEPAAGSYTPRSSAKACVEFMLSDLEESATRLTATTANGGWGSSNWGRVTSGTALALKGRVLLLWASPIFNRANDESRWQTAYTEMKEDLNTINACGYGLYTSSDNVNGSAFAKMFCQTGINPEAVFVTLYNNHETESDQQKNNPWERYIRPKNTTGSGKNASSMIVDMFPMADGKLPSTCETYTKLEKSSDNYDADHPFVSRDPRFYRTFAFPGFRWAYNGNATVADPNNPSYNNGADYELWNYVWYTDLNDVGNPESGNSYGADNLLTSKSGVYVRKRSDDADVNSPLYTWMDVDNNGGFAHSAQSYMEIRYAEVLLNFAEAACMAGHMSEAVEQLQKIRARAGFTATDNYGLQTNLTTDQATCMSAILYERQVELAYEGKRFDDLRRWMLFDGGAVEVDGAPASWKLTGWGGNTCTWLGFKQLNGQRRENMEFRTADAYGVGGVTAEDSSDPLKKAGVTRCAAVDLRQDLTDQVQTLADWYDQHLVRKEKKGDARNSAHVDLYMNFLPRYYILGLSSGAQNANLQLPQTIGWDDYNNGGAAGTFDPFAE